MTGIQDQEEGKKDLQEGLKSAEARLETWNETER